MALAAKQAYLFTYNALLAVGWFSVFVISCQACATQGYSAVYGSAANLTKLLIYVSIAETFHAAFLVRSGVMSNILQWVARAHALLLVVDPEPSVHQSMGAGAMILAWSFGESTRYPSCGFLFVCVPCTRLSVSTCGSIQQKPHVRILYVYFRALL